MPRGLKAPGSSVKDANIRHPATRNQEPIVLTLRERPTTIRTMAVLRISKEDLTQRLDASDAANRPTLVDARLRYAYEHSSVTLPAAVRVVPSDVNTTGLTKDRDVVVYDSDPGDITALGVAATLVAAGFRTLVLTGGLPDWIGANLPVEPKTGGPSPAPAVTA
jgi:rhodanese-related sulfurtransferase